MSILQEYQKHVELIGEKKYKALFEYIKEHELSYSELVYKKENWDAFDKWYSEVYNNRYGKSAGRNQKIQ